LPVQRFSQQLRVSGADDRFFREKVELKMTNPRPFGGFGNLYTGQAVRKGRLLYTGEAAGFQDALFGFGLRYAMLSGHLAARA